MMRRWCALLVALGCNTSPPPPPLPAARVEGEAPTPALPSVVGRELHPRASGSGTGSGTGTGTAAASSSSPPLSGISQGPGERTAPDAPPGLPAPAAIESRCCRLDRTTGYFGPEKGVNARYSGDVLLHKNGDRIHFPHDLISDTKELYQFARSSNKALFQERRMKIIGEGRSTVSVEIEDRGETGATTPFFHSKCATFDTNKKRALRIEDVAPQQASALLDEGRRRFEATPGHERYRFVPTSFALIGASIRFCGAFRDDQKPAPRLDVEVPWASP